MDEEVLNGFNAAGRMGGAVALARDAHLRRKVRAEDGAPGFG